MADEKGTIEKRTQDDKQGAEYDRSTDHLSSQDAAQNVADKIDSQRSEEEE